MVDKNGPSAHAGAWGLGWLSKKEIWIPGSKDIEKLISFISNQNYDIEAVYWLIGILGRTKNPLPFDVLIVRMDDTRGRVSSAAIDALGNIGDPRVVDLIIKKMDDKNADVRKAAINALGKIKDHRVVDLIIKKLDDENSGVRSVSCNALGNIGDPYAVTPLIKKLDDETSIVRHFALGALAKIREDETDQKLLSWDVDASCPWLNPQEPIDEVRVKEAADELDMNEGEIRQRYERLAEKYKLKLSWKTQ